MMLVDHSLLGLDYVSFQDPNKQRKCKVCNIKHFAILRWKSISTQRRRGISSIVVVNIPRRGSLDTSSISFSGNGYMTRDV